jgi:SAM-dependent methyltransferase
VSGETAEARDVHPEAYGEGGLGLFERSGMVWRQRPVLNHVKKARPQSMLDLGCGFQADLLTSVGDRVPRRVGVDLAVDAAHAQAHGLELVPGALEDVLGALEPASFDYVTILSVLEHVSEPQPVLDGIHRVLQPGGVAHVHVPTWLGKPVLEFAAFKRGLGTESIDDHRCYYQISQLWPMLVRAGFRPRHIVMRYHMAGFALKAVVRREGP